MFSGNGPSEGPKPDGDELKVPPRESFIDRIRRLFDSVEAKVGEYLKSKAPDKAVEELFSRLQQFSLPHQKLKDGSGAQEGQPTNMNEGLLRNLQCGSYVMLKNLEEGVKRYIAHLEEIQAHGKSPDKSQMWRENKLNQELEERLLILISGYARFMDGIRDRIILELEPVKKNGLDGLPLSARARIHMMSSWYKKAKLNLEVSDDGYHAWTAMVDEKCSLKDAVVSLVRISSHVKKMQEPRG